MLNKLKEFYTFCGLDYSPPVSLTENIKEIIGFNKNKIQDVLK